MANFIELLYLFLIWYFSCAFKIYRNVRSCIFVTVVWAVHWLSLK